MGRLSFCGVSRLTFSRGEGASSAHTGGGSGMREITCFFVYFETFWCFSFYKVCFYFLNRHVTARIPLPTRFAGHPLPGRGVTLR